MEPISRNSGYGWPTHGQCVSPVARAAIGSFCEQFDRLRDAWLYKSMRHDAAWGEAAELHRRVIDLIGKPVVDDGGVCIDEAEQSKVGKLLAERAQEVAVLIKAMRLSDRYPLGGDTANSVRQLNYRRAASSIGPVEPEILY